MATSLLKRFITISEVRARQAAGAACGGCRVQAAGSSSRVKAEGVSQTAMSQLC